MKIFKQKQIGTTILIALSLITIVSLFFLDPIVQDEHYHAFSDTRNLLSIPNFWNVISNGLFIVVGMWGLVYRKLNKKTEMSYTLLFFGIITVGIGSGYYHFFPSTTSLVWDRLPMTIVFMTLFSIIIREYISDRLGRFLLLPLVTMGLFSIGYWVFNESHDLRVYGVVQFYPMLAIPVILIFFKSKYQDHLVYWILLGCYVTAKLFEHYDTEIHQLVGFISGHSLKHIMASVGLYILVRSYKKRSPTSKQKLDIVLE